MTTSALPVLPRGPVGTFIIDIDRSTLGGRGRLVRKGTIPSGTPQIEPAHIVGIALVLLARALVGFHIHLRVCLLLPTTKATMLPTARVSFYAVK